jgi:hypothetical protein
MRTEVNIRRSEYPFGYGQGISFMGSCFSEHIGKKLIERKFKVDLNPFGILYNPVSIASGLQRMVQNKPYSENELFFHQGWWHSFDHHSSFSNADKQACLEEINSRLIKSSRDILSSDYLFVTFGTSIVYIKAGSGQVVSNCHQLPPDLFETQLLRVGDIDRMYTILIQELSARNKNLKWVFTVSPVRHWKNGPVDNQVSKSTLILAVSELRKKFENVGYFPAYELFMDDLRDYRYYSDDMLHPGSQGIEYTWNKFSGAYLTDNSLNVMKKIESLIKAKNHRPRNIASDEYRQFRQKQYEKTLQLSDEHPEIVFKEFLDHFNPENKI